MAFRGAISSFVQNSFVLSQRCFLAAQGRHLLSCLRRFLGVHGSVFLRLIEDAD